MIEMAECKPYPFFIKRAVRKYLKKEYGKDEAARLFREHTVATGSKYCDFWYLGDREA